MAWRVEFLPDNDPHGLDVGYGGPLKGCWKYRIGDRKDVYR